VWDKNPAARDVLRATRVSDLMMPAPTPLLKPTSVMRDVASEFVNNPQEFFYVSTDGVNLEGIVTMTDLIRAHSSGKLAGTPVSALMVKNPITVAADDDCLTAEGVMLEHQLKWLPVVASKSDRRIAGSLRLRRLIGHVLQTLK
jgi:CBS domain-containing protein